MVEALTLPVSDTQIHHPELTGTRSFTWIAMPSSPSFGSEGRVCVIHAGSEPEYDAPAASISAVTASLGARLNPHKTWHRNRAMASPHCVWVYGGLFAPAHVSGSKLASGTAALPHELQRSDLPYCFDRSAKLMRTGARGLP